VENKLGQWLTGDATDAITEGCAVHRHERVGERHDGQQVVGGQWAGYGPMSPRSEVIQFLADRPCR